MGESCKIVFALVLCLVASLGPVAGAARAQTIHYTTRPNAKRGAVVYKDGCIACHGSDGDGAPEYLSKFTRPDTWPEFSKCDQTTPEVNADYKAVIVYGGPFRGFSQIMPAFGRC